MRLVRQRTDSSSERVLAILDAFTDDKPIWTADELIARFSVARATIYRHLKALVETGFLAPLGGGAFGVGPRVIQMDRQIRIADPLLKIAKPIMLAQRDVVAGAQLLCRYYGFSVVSIHDDHGDLRIKTSFDRGRPFSLLLGAPSRAILGHLPPKQLQRLFLNHSQEIGVAGLGMNWPEFRDQMRLVKRRGYAVSSDIDIALVGVAAPIFVAPETVVGSLCLVRIKAEVVEHDLDTLSQLVLHAAARITAELKSVSALIE